MKILKQFFKHLNLERKQISQSYEDKNISCSHTKQSRMTQQKKHLSNLFRRPYQQKYKQKKSICHTIKLFESQVPIGAFNALMFQ